MLAQKLCSCIKSVRSKLKTRSKSKTIKVKGKRIPSTSYKNKESAAIGICVRSVLHSRGKTVKRFQCAKPMRLVTQKLR
jgi:hypothetical protein